MANVTIQAIARCTGGDHFILQLTVNGTPRTEQVFHFDELVSAFDDDEAKSIIKGLTRMHALGLNRNQIMNDLANGFSFTI